MKSIEGILDAHGIGYLSVEHEGRVKIQMVGLNLISSLGAHHYRFDGVVPNKIISIIEWADGQEFPDIVIAYLKALASAHVVAQDLLANGECDHRVFPALGIYVTDENPSLSIPLDFKSDCIAIMTISDIVSPDNDAINTQCSRLMDISNLLEQAMNQMGVRIE